MKHRFSIPSRQRQRSFRLSSEQLSGGLKNLGILLLGVGLGASGTSWLAPKTTSPAPISAESVPASPSPLQSPSPSPFPSPFPSASVNPSPVKDNVVSATVCVKTPMGNQQACASGVSIDPQLVGLSSAQGALVLTNYHVIADMGARPPLQLNGKGQVYNAEILRQSSQFDLALLWVPKAQFPIAALADASPEQGTAVRAIGFPNNQPLTIKDSSLLGKTQNCLAIAPCLALQQGTITFGNSGGPLEANGKVIGITQGEIVDEIAIPVEQIRQFLAGQAPAGRPQFNPDFPSEQVPRNRRPRYQPGFPPMQEPPYFPPDAPPGYPAY